MPYEIVTTADVKAYLGIAVATYDTLLDDICARVTDMIETYCQRKFYSRAYTDEMYDGTGTRQLLLRNPPITIVSRCCVGKLEVVSITNTATDATRAIVTVSSTGMTLTVTGGALAGTDSLTWAVSTTLDTVVTAINAAGNGWSASVSSANYGDYVSTDILMAPGRDALNGTVYLEIPDQPGMVDYDCDWNAGILINRAGNWPCGHQNIIVDCTAGYATLPLDIEQAAIEVVAAVFNRRDKDGALESERLGDYSYKFNMIESDLPPWCKATLRRYRDRRGMGWA